MRGGSKDGGSRGVGVNGGANGDRSVRGGSGSTFGGGNGAVGMTANVPPTPGLGMNMGDGDLLFVILLRFLRRF